MPPDKSLSEIPQLSTYSGNEDTVVMDRSNSEYEENKEKEPISTTTSTSNSNSNSSYQETRRFNSNLPCQVIETKEMIQFRHDNLIYLVSSTGEPCDEGARKVIEFNKIESSQNFKPISVNYTLKRSKLNHFAPCIKGIEPESISTIKENVYKALVELKNLVSKLNLKTLSIGKSEILEIINKNNIKIQYKNGSKIVHTNRLRISHINQIIIPKRKNRKIRIANRNITVVSFSTKCIYWGPTKTRITAYGFIGYDCGSRHLNVTTLSSLEVGNCDLPETKINITRRYVQILQINQYTETRIIQCKMEIHHTIYYYGMSSHISIVLNGENEYINGVSRSACQDVHKTGILKVSE